MILGTFLLVWFTISRWSYSYDADGHFYTALTIQQGRQPPFAGGLRDQAMLLAFCAQVPDLTKEFDATTLRLQLIPTFSGSAWGAFSRCWSEEVCHMVTVHHYLHGLTDTDAELVTQAAEAILRSLLSVERNQAALEEDRVCAAGFALHLLGDSFAHRRLKADKRMYPPGHGHAFDDLNPDYILYNEGRSRLWILYTERLKSALNLTVAAARWIMLSAVAKQHLTGATKQNHFNEPLMIAGLKGALKSDIQIWAPYNPPLEQTTARSGWWPANLKVKRSCEKVLHDYFPSKNLSCQRIWDVYKKAAIPVFAELKIPAVCPEDKGLE